jgi:hypothetical protein
MFVFLYKNSNINLEVQIIFLFHKPLPKLLGSVGEDQNILLSATM